MLLSLQAWLGISLLCCFSLQARLSNSLLLCCLSLQAGLGISPSFFSLSAGVAWYFSVMLLSLCSISMLCSLLLFHGLTFRYLRVCTSLYYFTLLYDLLCCIISYTTTELPLFCSSFLLLFSIFILVYIIIATF